MGDNGMPMYLPGEEWARRTGFTGSPLCLSCASSPQTRLVLHGSDVAAGGLSACISQLHCPNLGSEMLAKGSGAEHPSW